MREGCAAGRAAAGCVGRRLHGGRVGGRRSNSRRVRALEKMRVNCPPNVCRRHARTVGCRRGKRYPPAVSLCWRFASAHVGILRPRIRWANDRYLPQNHALGASATIGSARPCAGDCARTGGLPACTKEKATCRAFGFLRKGPRFRRACCAPESGARHSLRGLWDTRSFYARRTAVPEAVTMSIDPSAPSTS